MQNSVATNRWKYAPVRVCLTGIPFVCAGSVGAEIRMSSFVLEIGTGSTRELVFLCVLSMRYTC